MTGCCCVCCNLVTSVCVCAWNVVTYCIGTFKHSNGITKEEGGGGRGMEACDPVVWHGTSTTRTADSSSKQQGRHADTSARFFVSCNILISRHDNIPRLPPTKDTRHKAKPYGMRRRRRWKTKKEKKEIPLFFFLLLTLYSNAATATVVCMRVWDIPRPSPTQKREEKRREERKSNKFPNSSRVLAVAVAVSECEIKSGWDGTGKRASKICAQSTSHQQLSKAKLNNNSRSPQNVMGPAPGCM